MPVNITNEELDIFNKNGFTDEDVQATVENYRNQGLDDIQIRAKIDTRLNSWKPQQPKQELKVEPLKNQPKINMTPPKDTYEQDVANFENKYGDLPPVPEVPEGTLKGEVSKNYRQELDSQGKVHYVDENGKEVVLQSVPDKFKRKVKATVENIDRFFNRPSLEETKNREKRAWDVAKLGTELLGGAVGGVRGFALAGGLNSLADDWREDKPLDYSKAGLTAGGYYLGGKAIDNPVTRKLLSKGVEIAKPVVQKAIRPITRRIDIAKRRNTPVFQRIEEQVNDITKKIDSGNYTEQDLVKLDEILNKYGTKEKVPNLSNELNEVNTTENITSITGKNRVNNPKNLKEAKTNIRSNYSDKTKLDVVVNNYKDNYFSSVPDTMQNAYEQSSRKVNDLIKEIAKNPEIINDTAKMAEFEQKFNNAVSFGDDNFIKHEGERFWNAVSDANKYLEIKNKPNYNKLESDKENYLKVINNIRGNVAKTGSKIKVLSETPDIWQSVGLPNRIMIMKKNGFKKSSNIPNRTKTNHDVGDEVLNNLPELLQDPVYIMPSTSEKGSFVGVLKALDKKGYPVNVAIKPTKDRIEVNLIKSAYGRENFDNWITKQKILYKDEKYQFKPHSPIVGQGGIGTNTTISNFTDNFNPSGKNIRQLGQSDDVANTIGKQNLEYDQLHNSEIVNQAQKDIAENTSLVKSNLMNKASGKEQLNALDFEQGRQLLQKLYAEGKTQEAINLVEVLAKKGTEAGQAVQAMSLWSKTTPEGAELYAQRIIDKYNKANPKKKITLSAEERAKIRELAENINTAEDKDFATQLMLKEIASKVPSSFLQKTKTLRNISLLLNPKTLIRNVAGNAIFATAEKGSQALAAPIDKALSLVTGKRTRVTPQFKEYFGGLKEGATKGIRDVNAGVDTRGLGQRFDLPSSRSFNGGVLGALEKGLDYGLRVPDRMFYQAAFDESVANQLAAQGLKEPTQEILNRANQEALEAVFQNNGVISDAVIKGRRALNTIGTPELGLGDFAIPYAQTPANLVQQGINYSPLGLIKAGVNLSKGDQRQASMDIARALVGSGIGLGGYGLAKAGLATGDIEDYQKKQNLQAINERPYNISTPWFDFSYNQLQPMSVPFSAGVAAATGESPVNAAVNTLVEMPFMDNASRFIRDEQNYGIGQAALRQLASYPGQFVPTTVNQLNTYIDPTYREVYDPNFATGELKRASAKIPGVSRLLPAKTDVRGKEIKKDLNPFNVFLNPVFINKREDDPTMNEVLRLQETTGENTLLPVADKKIAGTDKQGNKINKKLSADEYSTYKTKLGERTYSLLGELMSTNLYQSADDTKKASMIKALKEDVKAMVEGEMFNKRTKYDKQPKRKKNTSNKKIKNFVKNNY